MSVSIELTIEEKKKKAKQLEQIKGLLIRCFGKIAMQKCVDYNRIKLIARINGRLDVDVSKPKVRFCFATDNSIELNNKGGVFYLNFTKYFLPIPFDVTGAEIEVSNAIISSVESSKKEWEFNKIEDIEMLIMPIVSNKSKAVISDFGVIVIDTTTKKELKKVMLAELFK